MSKKIVLVTLLMASSLQACAIERHDVLECGLPDGSKFVLKAAYDWSPLARLIPADVAERVNQKDFKAFYREGHIEIKIPRAGASHAEFRTDPTGNSSCQDFGKVGKAAYWGGFPAVLIIQRDNPEVIVTTWDDKLDIFGLPKEATLELQRQYRLKIKQMHLSRTSMVSTLIDKAIYWETGLIKESCDNSRRFTECPTVAVFQSTSTDQGKTWSDPIITTDAKIFELGRSLREQSFIARPTSINGKKVEAHFPPPQTPEERKRFLETQPNRLLKIAAIQ